MLWSEFLLISGLGLLFGALGGPLAYIIFYREYIHHFKHERARKLALHGATVAFMFFVGLSIAAAFVITQFIVPR